MKDNMGKDKELYQIHMINYTEIFIVGYPDTILRYASLGIYMYLVGSVREDYK